MTHQAQPPPPWPPWHRRPGPLLAVAVAAIVAIGIGGSLIGESTPSDQEIAEDALEGSGAISDSDAEILTAIGRYGERWSEVAAAIIRDHLDVAVTAERWLADAGPHMASLRGVIGELHGAIDGIDDPALAAAARGLATTYDERYAALERLVAAVERGDLPGEEEAIRAVDAAAAEGRRLATDLLSRLEPYFDGDLGAELDRRFEDLKRQVLGE